MQLSPIIQKRLFILGSFIVLLLSVLLYYRINSLVDNYSRLNHTNTIELNLEQILSYVKDAETAQRGFLLTKDSSFLRPYYGTEERVNAVLKNIKKNLGKTEQKENLANLKLYVDKQFQLLNHTLKIAAADRQPVDSLQRNLYQDLIDSKATMDRIRQYVSKIQYEQSKNLRQRESLIEHYVRLTPMSLMFLVFAMLAIIGFSYHGLTKQLNQTRIYANDLDYLNNELLSKNQQLENSIEELNSFNYIASHDLKEPLRRILFFTDMIKGKTYELPQDVRDNLDKINTSGERMKTLLDDLLTYAQASMAERKIETVDLNTVLANVTESLSQTIAQKGAEIKYANLPVVPAIASQMQQLFENLLSNAIKYSKVAVPPVITLTSNVVLKKALPPAFESTHDRFYQIRIQDNGIGFTQDNADKIFVLFQRLHQRHEFSGTGIGLTICKKIVQNHQGFIMAESEVEKGTTFFVFLPA